MDISILVYLRKMQLKFEFWGNALENVEIFIDEIKVIHSNGMKFGGQVALFIRQLSWYS
jgi:hypothetical protein